MNKEINNIRKNLNSLKNTELQNLRSKEKLEKGIVRTVSPQGDRLFLCVQRLPSEVLDPETNTINVVDGLYFGNEQGLPESEVTMAELLIEADVDLSTIKYDPVQWIGIQVNVAVVDKRAVRVLLQSPLSNPRLIPPEDIKIARTLSPNKTINSKESKEYLESLGYSRSEVDATVEETFESIGPRGFVLRYGDSTTWHDAAIPKGSDAKNIEESSNKGIVTHLYGGNLNNKYCFQPTKAITAR